MAQNQDKWGKAKAAQRVKGYNTGGAVKPASSESAPPERAAGGRIKMTAGAESGEGRLQKAKKY